MLPEAVIVESPTESIQRPRAAASPGRMLAAPSLSLPEPGAGATIDTPPSRSWVWVLVASAIAAGVGAVALLAVFLMGGAEPEAPIEPARAPEVLPVLELLPEPEIEPEATPRGRRAPGDVEEPRRVADDHIPFQITFTLVSDTSGTVVCHNQRDSFDRSWSATFPGYRRPIPCSVVTAAGEEASFRVFRDGEVSCTRGAGGFRCLPEDLR